MSAESWMDNSAGESEVNTSREMVDARHIDEALVAPQDADDVGTTSTNTSISISPIRTLKVDGSDAAVDFPNALPPQEWYQWPPIPAGRPKPFCNTSFGKLPAEILRHLFDLITEYDRVLNLVDPHAMRHRGKRHYRGMWGDRYFLRGLDNMMHACHDLRVDLADHIISTTTHICDNALKMSIVSSFYGAGCMQLPQLGAEQQRKTPDASSEQLCNPSACSRPRLAELTELQVEERVPHQ